MDNEMITNNGKESFTSRRVVYYILGILEVMFTFRLVFKLLGANPNSGLVSLIYSVSQVFLIPFNAIFRSATTQGIEATAVLEPSTIIAMIVYAVIAWGVVKLLLIVRNHNNK